MRLKDLIPPAVKSALFTEDAVLAPALPARSVPAAPTLPAYVQTTWGTTTPTPTTVTTPPAPAKDILAGNDTESLAKFASLLRSRTDFDSTAIGLLLQEHVAPLAGLTLTEEQVVTTALKAGVKDGLTGDAILAEYARLLAVLEDEQRTFDRSAAAATKTEVDDCRAAIQAETEHIQALEAQITAARAHQSAMSTDMIAAQTRIAQRKAQFAAAYSARQAELQSAISRYQFLKGTPPHVDVPVST